MTKTLEALLIAAWEPSRMTYREILNVKAFEKLNYGTLKKVASKVRPTHPQTYAPNDKPTKCGPQHYTGQGPKWVPHVSHTKTCYTWAYTSFQFNVDSSPLQTMTLEPFIL